MKKILMLAVATAIGLAIAASAKAEMKRVAIKPPNGHALSEIISGYEYRSKETKVLQDDDIQNPGFIWVEQGEELWSQTDGSAGKSCASCHDDATESMATVGTVYPKWDDKVGKPVSLEQRINTCRKDNMGAKPWKWESGPLLSMTTYVRHQSRGKPVNVSAEGPAASWAERGKKLYYQRVGQLDMACSSCHEDNYGNRIRADMLSQGQSNGFPTYRFKWQKIGSIHRRFKGCMKNIRATPYKVGSDEFVALELYLATRGVGLPVETPAVRN